MPNDEREEILPVIPDDVLDFSYADDPDNIISLMNDKDERRRVAKEIQESDSTQDNIEEITEDEIVEGKKPDGQTTDGQTTEEKPSTDDDEVITLHKKDFEQFKRDKNGEPYQNGKYFGRFDSIAEVVKNYPELQKLASKKASEISKADLEKYVQTEPQGTTQSPSGENVESVRIGDHEFTTEEVNRVNEYTANLLYRDPEVLQQFYNYGVQLPKTQDDINALRKMRDIVRFLPQLEHDEDIAEEFKDRDIPFPKNREELEAVRDGNEHLYNLLRGKVKEIGATLYNLLADKVQTIRADAFSVIAKGRETFAEKESIEDRIFVDDAERLASRFGFSDTEKLSALMDKIKTDPELRKDDRYYRTENGIRVLRDRGFYNFVRDLQDDDLLGSLEQNAISTGKRRIQEKVDQRRNDRPKPLAGITSHTGDGSAHSGGALPSPEEIYGPDATENYTHDELKDLRTQVKRLPNSIRKPYEDYCARISGKDNDD